MPFRNLTREEAVQFLLGLPPGEDMELVTQSKQDSECPRACGAAWQSAEFHIYRDPRWGETEGT
jgi:hypothetical protein